MNNFWKWVLGIVIVLVVLFGLGIGSHLLMRAVYPGTAVGVERFTSPMMVRVGGAGDLEQFTSPMVIGGRGMVGIGMMGHGIAGNILKHGHRLAVLVVECDLGLIDTARTHWPFLRDRRIDAYGDLTQRYID